MPIIKITGTNFDKCKLFANRSKNPPFDNGGITSASIPVIGSNSDDNGRHPIAIER
jgi:hypothetical protein